MKLKWFGCRDAAFDDVKRIRNAVFTAEQGASADEEYDAFDASPETRYALIYDGDTAVATGRIALYDGQYKIGRIAVLPSQRGRGTGALLVRALCEEATACGAGEIFVDAQLHAVPFYEKLGFKCLSDEVIIDRGLPHLKMKRGQNYGKE